MSLPHLFRKPFLRANCTQLQWLCPLALSPPSLMGSSGYDCAVGNLEGWGLPGWQGWACQGFLSHHLIQEQSGAPGHIVPYQAPLWGGTGLAVPSGSATEICSLPNTLLPALKMCVASVNSPVLWKKTSAHLYCFLHQNFFLVLLCLSCLKCRESTIPPEHCDATDPSWYPLLVVPDVSLSWPLCLPHRAYLCRQKFDIGTVNSAESQNLHNLISGASATSLGTKAAD